MIAASLAMRASGARSTDEVPLRGLGLSAPGGHRCSRAQVLRIPLLPQKGALGNRLMEVATWPRQRSFQPAAWYRLYPARRRWSYVQRVQDVAVERSLLHSLALEEFLVLHIRPQDVCHQPFLQILHGFGGDAGSACLVGGF